MKEPGSVELILESVSGSRVGELLRGVPALGHMRPPRPGARVFRLEVDLRELAGRGASGRSASAEPSDDR